jgi:hypothetical protein
MRVSEDHDVRDLDEFWSRALDAMKRRARPGLPRNCRGARESRTTQARDGGLRLLRGVLREHLVERFEDPVGILPRLDAD